MKPKPLRLLVLCVLLFGSAAALQPWLSSGLPKAQLPGGRELRVLQITCGSSTDRIHDLAGESPARTRFRNVLPQALHRFMSPPAPGIPGYSVPGNSKIVSLWVAALKPREAYRILVSGRGLSCPGSEFIVLTLQLRQQLPTFRSFVEYEDSLAPVGGVEIGSQQTDWQHEKSMMLVNADLQIPAFRTGEARQFILLNPPSDIRELRFAVPASSDTPSSMFSSQAESRAHLAARENPIELTIPNPAYQKP